jgi:hypothetical protein
MNQTEKNPLDWYARIGAVIGLVILLSDFFLRITNLAQSSTGTRVAASTGFALYLATTLWLVFKATDISPRLRWALMGLGYVVTILFFTWAGSWFSGGGGKIQPVPPLPANVPQRLDFENGLPPAATLGVCDNDKPDWYNNCDNFPQRLNLASAGFTGQKSLQTRVEILADKPQVYTLRVPIDPPLFADVVSANVYSEHADWFTKISLAARVKGENTWVFTDLVPSKNGWLRLVTDLQPFKSSGEIAVDEIHIDMFLKKGTSDSLEQNVWVDDIELVYPLAKPYKTAP